MKYVMPSIIKNDYNSYNELLKLNSYLEYALFCIIKLDFNNTIYFEASLVAMLGAILEKNYFNKVTLINLNSNIEKVLKRNLFLTVHEKRNLTETFNDSIKYQRFSPKEINRFSDYLNQELLSKTKLNKLSLNDLDLLPLRRKFKQTILELFDNVRVHGNTQNVFCCGQILPEQSKICFTIVDIGNTFKDNVNKFTQKNYTGIEAITWALEKDNSTKSLVKKHIPGGNGFYYILNFIGKNDGKIQIISADGYFEKIGLNEPLLNKFDSEFPGVAVSIEFNIK